MKILACFIFIALLSANSLSQEFTSPRATAIGGYIAVSNDLYGMDWNFAGMAFSKASLEMAFSSADGLADGIEGFENFRFVWRPWSRHVVAFRNTPSLVQEHRIRKSPFNPAPEDITPLHFVRRVTYEGDLALGYAFRLTSRFAVGLDLTRQIFSVEASSNRFLSLNISGYFKISDRLSFGVVSRNTHNFKYKEHFNRVGFIVEDSLRVIAVDFDAFQTIFNKPNWRLDFGVAARPFNSLLLTFDLFSDRGYGVGFEWEAPGSIFLRSAISHKSDHLFKPEKVFGATWGLGWRYHNLARFDLAYYFPYGGRNGGSESTFFGEFEIRPVKNDAFLLSIAFFLP